MMPRASKSAIVPMMDAAKAREQRVSDRLRGSARERGYTNQWDKARTGWLAKHPLCAECERKGIVEPATLVDHVVPHKGDMDLFWDTSNWQGLCRQCHAIKSGRELGKWRPSSVIGQRDVTVVWGPPGSGKSTYVAQHKRHGDIVLDLDLIVSALLGGAQIHERSSQALDLAIGCRELLLNRIAEPSWSGTAWVITTTPYLAERDALASRLKASVIEIVPDQDECKRRIEQDARPQERDWSSLVDRWYEARNR